MRNGQAEPGLPDLLAGQLELQQGEPEQDLSSQGEDCEEVQWSSHLQEEVALGRESAQLCLHGLVE